MTKVGDLKVTVTITEVSTSRSITYPDDFPYWDDSNPVWDTLHYMWTGGNYSCDCNRKLFFYQQLESRDLPDIETPCGQDKYIVKLVLDDGTVILDEI